MFIYFTCSWFVGLAMILVARYFENIADFFALFLLTIINFFINSIFILFQAIMIYVFPENRKEFLISIVILFFNFPFVAFAWLLLIANSL